MKIQIKKLNLEVIRLVDKFYYYSDMAHRFSDEQFQDFLWEQMTLGCDPVEIELDLDNGEAAYYVDGPASQIYFFENIIEKHRKEARESFEEENGEVSRLFKKLAMRRGGDF